MFKKISLFFVLTLVIGALSACAPHNEDSGGEEPEMYAPDHVLVMLTNEASLKCLDYTPADFPEICCIRVAELASYKKETVRAKLANDPTLIKDKTPEEAQAAMDRIDLETYKVVLALYLEKPGKEAVLDAIEKLQQRDDIEVAEPDYYMYQD